ncbi:MAG: potassium-transporting ATPase subunit C [Bacteroidia bacterium]
MKTKQYITMSIKLSMLMLLLCCVCYPALITGIAQATPGQGRGERVLVNGKPVGYERVGQRFASERYFWSRPSAVEYNAAGSGGSNQGPSNPAHLELVAARMDNFLVHHPGVRREQVPADMVTASGSGLDPHISPALRGFRWHRWRQCGNCPGIPWLHWSKGMWRRRSGLPGSGQSACIATELGIG